MMAILFLFFALGCLSWSGFADAVCQDSESQFSCKYWKSQGYCTSNSWVKENCQHTCNACPSCQDTYGTNTCQGWASSGYCTISWVRDSCAKSCGVCTGVPVTTKSTTTTTTTTTSTCSDRDPLSNCQSWRRSGYCKTNTYVKAYCKATCGLCTGVPTTKGVPTTRGPTSPPGQCGRPSIQTSRVIAGQTAKQGQWPWQIAMYRNGQFFCGGSLIAPNWIATAAHCLDRVSASSVSVVLGDLHRSQKSGHEQTISVSKIIMHENYGNLNNDIALMKLSTPAKLNNQVKTICLPKHGAHVPVGSNCYITGWGKTRHPGSSVVSLQQASLTVMSKSECSKTNSKYVRITDQMVCARNSHPNRQSGCHGDSGGPFVCQQAGGSWTLHGAVSWGSPQCDINDAMTVFSRVSALRNWIDNKMRSN